MSFWRRWLAIRRTPLSRRQLRRSQALGHPRLNREGRSRRRRRSFPGSHSRAPADRRRQGQSERDHGSHLAKRNIFNHTVGRHRGVEPCKDKAMDAGNALNSGHSPRVWRTCQIDHGAGPILCQGTRACPDNAWAFPTCRLSACFRSGPIDERTWRGCSRR
jgi:hypothetical protein